MPTRVGRDFLSLRTFYVCTEFALLLVYSQLRTFPTISTPFIFALMRCAPSTTATVAARM